MEKLQNMEEQQLQLDLEHREKEKKRRRTNEFHQKHHQQRKIPETECQMCQKMKGYYTADSSRNKTGAEMSSPPATNDDLSPETFTTIGNKKSKRPCKNGPLCRLNKKGI